MNTERHVNVSIATGCRTFHARRNASEIGYNDHGLTVACGPGPNLENRLSCRLPANAVFAKERSIVMEQRPSRD